MGKRKGDVGLPFIFTVTVGSGQSFQLPTVSSGTYDAIIEWGDTTSNALTVWNEAGRTHTYTTGGTYEVRISGVFDEWRVNNYADRFKITEVKQWGVLSFGTSAFAAFRGCSNLIITANDLLDTSLLISMNGMFQDCSSIVTIPNLDLWDVNNVQFYGSEGVGMFSGCSNFNQNIENWSINTSEDVDMRFMFNGCFAYNQPLNGWNVSRVINMRAMFRSCSIFNKPLNNWNVVNVANMSVMFEQTNQFNQSLNDWNVASLNSCGSMFFNAKAYNQDMNNWNVAGINSVVSMFRGASAFNGNVDNWQLSSASNWTGMFLQATSFNRDISSWPTGHVTSFGTSAGFGMLAATSFNRDISAWNVSSLTSAFWFLRNSGLSTANYDLLLIGWSAQSVQNNVTIDFTGTKYTAGGTAEAARNTLTTTYGWTIIDDGPA